MKTHLLHGLRAAASAAVAVALALATSPYARDLVAHVVAKHPAFAVYVPVATIVVSALEKWARERHSKRVPPLAVLVVLLVVLLGASWGTFPIP